MDKVAVVIVGLALIAWVNWYFFLSERSHAAREEGHVHE